MDRGQPAWKSALNLGGIGAVTAVLLSLVGMVEAFSKRDILYETVNMGHTLLLLVGVFIAYLSAKRVSRKGTGAILGASLLTGTLTAGGTALLVLIGTTIRMRAVFVNASPTLFGLLTFGFEPAAGIPFLLLAGLSCGFFAFLLFIAPTVWRKMLITGLTSVAVAGVLQDLLRTVISIWGPLAGINEYLFAANGLTLGGGLGMFLIICTAMFFWSTQG